MIPGNNPLYGLMSLMPQGGGGGMQMPSMPQMPRPQPMHGAPQMGGMPQAMPPGGGGKPGGQIDINALLRQIFGGMLNQQQGAGGLLNPFTYGQAGGEALFKTPEGVPVSVAGMLGGGNPEPAPAPPPPAPVQYLPPPRPEEPMYADSK